MVRRDPVQSVRLIVAVGFLLTAACQETIYLQTRKFDELVVLAADPARRLTSADGKASYEPVCRGADSSAEALLLHVLLRGTFVMDENEQDLSVKPGDKVGMGKVTLDNLSQGRFDLHFTCMEEASGELDYTDQCSGIQFPPSDFDGLDFYRYGGPDDNGGTVALVVLIDMSGSMKGLTMQTPPYNEDSKDNVVFQMGSDFIKLATDKNESRIAAVKSLIHSLNPEDRLLVLAFNEQAVDVVCELPGWDNEAMDYEQRKEQCFGTNRDLVIENLTGPSALDGLQGQEGGRTPLWLAVRDAYEFLEQNPHAQDADFRHIIVVGDGPDTCGLGAEGSQCTGPCGNNLGDSVDAFQDFRAELESQPFEERIPVHFVQMKAVGYPERDPRQMEVACLTGGHYRFLNLLDLAEEDRPDLVRDALVDIRSTFRGYWRFAVRMPSLASDMDLFPGRLYLLGGDGTVLPGEDELLTANPRDFQFLAMTDIGYEHVVPLDSRVAFRKACELGSDGPCPPALDEGECSVRKSWCDEETLTCLSALEWKPDGEDGGCYPQSAVVSVEVEGEQGTTKTEEVSLGLVPTVCCMGKCRPPRPPEVPNELSHPTTGAACFWYQEEKGWTEKNPGSANQAWVYFATAKTGGDCDWAAIKASLKYSDPQSLAYPDDWDCEGENCFPPQQE